MSVQQIVGIEPGQTDDIIVCPVVIEIEIQGASKDRIRIFIMAAQREACFGRTVELVGGRQKTFQSCLRLQIDVPVEQRETIVELKRSEEHTSALKSLMRISYAVFCLTKKKRTHTHPDTHT